MKKVILVLLLLAGFSQLKAQDLLNSKSTFKFKADSSFKFAPVPPQLNNPFNSFKLKTPVQNVQVFNSTMPVVKVQSSDRMPILVLGNDGFKYTMLIKKIEVVDPNNEPSKPGQ
jgi:hypothetical protein